MDYLRCVVDRITFTNENNGYTVLRARAKGFDELVTAVGSMGAVNVGSVLSLKGEWRTDSKYGRQFAVSEYEETLPATVYGIEKYLGSGLIKGVGPMFAGRIVRTFGADTLRIIEESPQKLTEVHGIGEARVKMIIEAWQAHKEVKNIMLFLQEYGIGTGLAFRVFKEFGEASIGIVKENPFKLTEIWGVGFKTADTVAQKMGFGKDSPYRCRSGLLYVLSECANDGHCYMPAEELAQKASEILEVDAARLYESADVLVREGELIRDAAAGDLYLPSLFFSESGTARCIRTLLGGQTVFTDADCIIQRIEKAEGLKYDEIQKNAIIAAASSKVFVLTGGPGTGKTTTVKGIIAVFREAGMSVLLAAPTGRAAKRLSETTGMEAMTIHRLLEAKPPAGYQRCETNKLKGGALIVDESSMIDITLMYNLLRAVPDEMNVVFVGDVNQLPSVGAGNVLRDLIDSGVMPVVRLTRIFRQSRGSQIIMNAHRINEGKFPVLKTNRNSDFFFIDRPESGDIPATVIDLCAKRLPGYYRTKPSAIQVLCPMQRGENGARNLNLLLQDALNPSKKMLRRGGAEYRYGDKVMQIRNNYDKQVFNGDIGRITGVNEEEKTLSVSFDGGAPVDYDASELDELMLAYATSVHKAQGSEYDIVVMPVTTQHFMMLQRNLLYTGITRARKAVVLVGTVKAIGMAVKNDRVMKRNTRLAERLRE